MRDLHVHTEYSCDSEAKIEEYVQKGIADSIKQICFTDHVDMNKNDYGFNYYNPDTFFCSFNTIKEKYDGKIELLSGIEFGEPHLYYERLQELSKFPYDYIIGSIHWIGDMFPGQKIREQYTVKEFYTLYWQEILRTVKAGGFDALGHMDFPKRYLGEIYYEEAVLADVFKYVLDQNLVIEINTSSLRKGCDVMMPDRDILEIYKGVGGKFISIGSDSHMVQDLGANYYEAKKVITDLGLQEVFFAERKLIEV